MAVGTNRYLNRFRQLQRRLENTTLDPHRHRPKYLFVCGSQRSGTTLTAELLGRNDNIVIGIERFGNWECQRLGPGLFTRERFFDYRKRDTVLDFIADHPEHYLQARAKFDRAVCVGDKLPQAFATRT